MPNLPAQAQPIFLAFSVAFTAPTFQRWLVLALAAILTPGRRTLINLLWPLAGVAQGHVSSYHRVLSRRRFSLWKLARILAGLWWAVIWEHQAVHRIVSKPPAPLNYTLVQCLSYAA